MVGDNEYERERQARIQRNQAMLGAPRRLKGTLGSSLVHPACSNAQPTSRSPLSSLPFLLLLLLVVLVRSVVPVLPADWPAESQ